MQRYRKAVVAINPAAGPVSVPHPRNRQRSPRVRLFIGWIVQCAGVVPRNKRARRQRLSVRFGAMVAELST
jgi:hypothetical protein